MLHAVNPALILRPLCRNPDPPQLHGSYYDWTRRVEGKTKTVRLTEDHAKIIEEWNSNMRRVEKIVMEMESISVQAAAVKMKK